MKVNMYSITSKLLQKLQVNKLCIVAFVHPFLLHYLHSQVKNEMLCCVCLHKSAWLLDMLGCALWARCHFRVSDHTELHLQGKKARHSVCKLWQRRHLLPTCPQGPTCHEAHSCCWHVCTDSGLDESQKRSSSRSSPNWHQVCRCLYPFPQVTKHYMCTYTQTDRHAHSVHVHA